MWLGLSAELRIAGSIAGALLDWHNDELWKTPADSKQRKALGKWRESAEHLAERVRGMGMDPPKQNTKGVSEDEQFVQAQRYRTFRLEAKQKATAGLAMLFQAMPHEPGPNAAATLARESTRAHLRGAIPLLYEAASIIETLAPPPKANRTERKREGLTKGNLAKRLGISSDTLQRRYKKAGIALRQPGKHTEVVPPAELLKLQESDVLKYPERIKLERLMEDRGITRDGKVQATKRKP